MIDTNRPVCGAAVSAPDARLRCMHAVGGSHCNAAPGTCPHQVAPVSQPAASGLSLEDDTPLSGGACNLGGDCEACQ